MTIKSSGAPVTAIPPSVDARFPVPGYCAVNASRDPQQLAAAPRAGREPARVTPRDSPSPLSPASARRSFSYPTRTQEHPMTDDKRPRVFSGIQPTGQKTLGNYSGGFRQYAQTQETHDAFFCIVDLHSISVDYDPEALRTSTLDLAAMIFATGLDAERTTDF